VNPPRSGPGPLRRHVFLIGGFALLVVGIALVAGGYILDWRATRVGPLATWLSGTATFTAACVALYQAHRAQIEANEAKLVAEEARWDAERQRRVDTEMVRRREGMQLCMSILNRFAEARVVYADAFRIAALDFDNMPARIDRGFNVDLHWRKASAEIGVLSLPMRRTRFVHQLANEVLPAVEDVFGRCHIISEAHTLDELLEHFESSNVPFELIETLQEPVLDDFAPDIAQATKAVDADMPPHPRHGPDRP